MAVGVYTFLYFLTFFFFFNVQVAQINKQNGVLVEPNLNNVFIFLPSSGII